MGLFDFLSGSEPMLEYKIYISDTGEMKAETEGELEHPEEYGRFWAYYWAKISFNLGFPANYNGIEAFKALAKLAESGFKPTTEYLKNSDETYSYNPNLDTAVIDVVYEGEYLDKGESKALKSHFPMKINEKEVYLSAFALLEYCQDKMIKNSKYKKEVCSKFFENITMAMLGMYNQATNSSSGVGGVQGTVLVPENAFALAVEHTKEIKYEI